MTKAELAKEYGRSISSVYRSLQNIYGKSAGIDFTLEVEKEVRAYFEERGGVKVKKHEDKNAIYHEVYDELLAKGFMLESDMKERFNVRSLNNVNRAFEDLGLYTYDDTVYVWTKYKKTDGKYSMHKIERNCIRPVDKDWKN